MSFLWLAEALHSVYRGICLFHISVFLQYCNVSLFHIHYLAVQLNSLRCLVMVQKVAGRL